MDSEADEIYKICGVIGSPTTDTWADGLNLARAINYQFPQVKFSYFSLLAVDTFALGAVGPTRREIYWLSTNCFLNDRMMAFVMCNFELC